MGPLSLRIATYATGITDGSCASVAKGGEICHD
jgi:hypothetical protein